MDRIITGETALLSQGSFGSYEEFYQRWLVPTMVKFIGKVTNLNDIAPKIEVKAVCNWGRWIARCPFCAGAELVWEARLFMCCSCWNEQAGHKFLKVKLPSNKAQIEQELLKRPLPPTRNWEIGESIARLRKENKEHGVK
jgi:hypothetical protein